MSNETLSGFVAFFQPVVEALRALGGSGRPAEVKEWIAANRQPDPFLLTTLNKSGETKFSNQVDWARFYLVRAGWLESSKRGVWALTDKGRTRDIDSEVSRQIKADVEVATLGAAELPSNMSREETAPDSDGRDDHRSKVVSILQELSPRGFEHFCMRLLRESGFQRVEVTGRAGDKGIDGVGVLEINPFVSVRVIFQSKRWQGAVGAPEVRDLRGAMVGRAERAILLTTGTFTPEAVKEASRDGVTPIELFDGEAIVRLMESFELGLRPVQAFEVVPDFFREFSD